MKFGEYEILERIAFGGMAEVYRGRVGGAEGFEKLVAIKRVLPHLAQDERFVKMLLTEARIHAALSHRNIVQIHDLGVAEGEYFIVLEYVEGRDLRLLLDALAGRGERMSEALALFVAGELAQGLHFAHELKGPDGQPLGLVHRDVSPSNVLLSYAGEVKLSDFGLAKRRADQSVVGSLKGKLEYMSPEQARRGPLDRRTDIFSLGAMLFEMLTGRRLRDITDEVAGWREVASGTVPDPRILRPDLPEPLHRLLAEALAADPAQRFPDAGTFGVALRKLRDHMPVAAGAGDLQAVLNRTLPPGSPRAPSEASKVIRLVSEIPRPPRRPGAHPPPGMRPPPVPTEASTPRPREQQSSPPPHPMPPPPLSAQVEALPRHLMPPALRREPRSISNTDVLARFTPAARSPRPIVLGLIALVVAAAAVVHLRFVPLDVLAFWWEPTWLRIESDPPGARASLDGVDLPGPTPVEIEVRRDHVDHVVEIKRAGFRPARAVVRYDRSSSPTASVTLESDMRPAIEPIHDPTQQPTAADATATPAGAPLRPAVAPLPSDGGYDLGSQ